jgi:hypothetical protein
VTVKVNTRALRKSHLVENAKEYVKEKMLALPVYDLKSAGDYCLSGQQF